MFWGQWSVLLAKKNSDLLKILDWSKLLSFPESRAHSELLRHSSYDPYLLTWTTPISNPRHNVNCALSYIYLQMLAFASREVLSVIELASWIRGFKVYSGGICSGLSCHKKLKRVVIDKSHGFQNSYKDCYIDLLFVFISRGFYVYEASLHSLGRRVT